MAQRAWQLRLGGVHPCAAGAVRLSDCIFPTSVGPETSCDVLLVQPAKEKANAPKQYPKIMQHHNTFNI